MAPTAHFIQSLENEIASFRVISHKRIDWEDATISDFLNRIENKAK